MAAIAFWSKIVAWRGAEHVFWKLISRPVANENSWRMLFRAEAAEGEAASIIDVSSAYYNVVGGKCAKSG